MSWSPSSLPGHCCHLLLSTFVIVSGSPSKHPGSHCPLLILVIASQSSSPPPCSHHPLLILVVTSWSPSSPLPPHHLLLVSIIPSWSPLSPLGPQYLLLIPINVPIVSSLSSLSCPVPHPSMPSPTGAGLPGQWYFPGSLSVPSQAVPGQGASTGSPQPVGLGWLEPRGCS